jgi:hypothetical protein
MFFFDFLTALNKIPFFQGSTKVFIVENNYGNSGTFFWNLVKTAFPDLAVYCEKKDIIGTRKGPETADYFRQFFNVKLSHNRVRFDSNFFTSNKKKNANQMKTQCKEQLERYSFVFQKAKNDFVQPRQVITGKSGSTEQDDLAISTLMGVFYGHDIYNNPARVT